MSKLTFAVFGWTIFALLGASTRARAQQPVSPYFFGMSMTGAEINGEPWPVVPFSGIRLWDSDVPWSTLNPAPGVYDWRLLNIWMNQAKQNGLDIDYCFGRVPAWASSNAHDKYCANEPGSCDPPRDLNPDGSGTDQAWRDFVTAIATHAAGRIHYWELWDEFPDPMRWHWQTKGKGNATAQQLVRMAQDAREIIKRIDPSAVVISQSGALRFDLDYPRWESWAQAGGGNYADIIAFHSYVQLNTKGAPIPETLVGLLQGYTNYPFGASGFFGFLQTYNLTQPLWNTEGSWAADIAGLRDPDEQAGFLVRFYALNLSLGVSRFHWYEWDNTYGIGSLWKWFTRWDLALPNANGNVSVMVGFGDGSFQAAVNNGAGSNPDAAAVGDFNNDQALDLVVANKGSNDVTTILGNGDGTFKAGVSSAAGNSPVSVAVADFNKDGNLDVVVANATTSGTVSVLLGKGDGTFQTPVSYNVGSNPSSVAVGDFNNDGYPDIAVANAGSGTVSVLQNNGSGGFGTAVPYTVGNSPSAVAVGDFNNDTYADLAVTNGGDGTVSVLLNNGSGSFETAATYTVGNGPSAVAVADFNKDTYADLAVANQTDGSVSVLTNNKDGTFGSADTYAVGSQPVSIVAEDFNGDGDYDIGTANKGDSTVTTLEHCVGKNCSHAFNPAMPTNVGSSPVAMTVGAFDVVGNHDPGTLLKAGVAYESVYNWLVGNTISTACNGPIPDLSNPTQGVWTCRMAGANGYQAQLVWYMDNTYQNGCAHNQCNYVNYTVDPAQYAQYRTPYGQVYPIPENGIVPIGYIPILLENHNAPLRPNAIVRRKPRADK